MEKSNWWSYPVVMCTNTMCDLYLGSKQQLSDETECLLRGRELMPCTVKIVTTMDGEALEPRGDLLIPLP